uniref:ATP synthase F0 subunit 6 n=1 Tax=Xestocephalus biprocessus TaxID=3112134 RepID=UPI002E75CC99|nr:ATP synthase F0 subunit 6 [Xestocephalus biprocessus]WRK21288.1 ATP synthase F0 subunit 6 [Xestocephalus biprocessus]
MTNLFSTFDPCTGMMSMNWTSSMIIMVMMPYKLWKTTNSWIILMKKMYITLHKEMLSLMKYKGSTMMLTSTFMLIIYNNMMGLLPYVFTSTSHLTMSMTMAMPIWLGMMLYGWTNKTNKMFTHLVPTGTPPPLMPFMILIETISNMIRPISLMVRLSANMIAGHLLMTLLGNNPNITMVMTMIMFMTLLMFEVSVAIIQAYVFMTLTTLYSSEI